jgi:hypothetical protein
MSAAPILRGELGLIGLFDLGQLLMLNRATGCLTINKHDRRAFLYFAEGKLVNALDEKMAEGEAAAYRIFTWRSGSFDFRVEPRITTFTIETSTDSVMLEAARRMDEAQLAGEAEEEPAASSVAIEPHWVDDEPGGEADRLLERQAALEELREVFRRVVASAPARSSEDPGPLAALELLIEAEDRLMFQSGQRPALRHRGVWSDALPDVLIASGYQDVRGLILQRLETRDPAAVPGPRRMRLPHGSVVALEIVGSGTREALWLRPIELPPPEAETLNGDQDALAAVLDTHPAVVLVGGPDLGSTRALLHAMLAHLIENQQNTVLVVTDDPTYRLPGAAGVALRVPPGELRPSLRAVEPGVVGLDPAMVSGDITPEELTLVPHVLAGVVGADPGSLLARWLARLGGRGIQASACLVATSIGVVMAEEGEEGLGYSVYRYSDEERGLALRGVSVSPSPVLGRPSGASGRAA